jgi:hypothetical protein
MHAGDAYWLVGCWQVTPLINPVHGVQQGCTLSPLIFELSISDIGRLIGAPVAQGQPLGIRLQRADEGELNLDVHYLQTTWSFAILLMSACSYY